MVACGTLLGLPQGMQVDGSMAWVVSSQGLLMVARAKLQVGHAHRGKVVIVAIDDNQFRVLHDRTQLSAHPRTFIKEVTRRSASGHPAYQI